MKTRRGQKQPGRNYPKAGSFSPPIEPIRQSASGKQTNEGRTLDVSCSGEAGLSQAQREFLIKKIGKPGVDYCNDETECWESDTENSVGRNTYKRAQSQATT